MKDPQQLKRTLPSNGFHDLFTELSIIFLCCAMLRKTLQGILSEDQLRPLDKIEHSAKKMRDLTRSFSIGTSPRKTD